MVLLTAAFQCYELKKEKKDLCHKTFADIGKYIWFRSILLALQGRNNRIFKKLKTIKICLGVSIILKTDFWRPME